MIKFLLSDGSYGTVVTRTEVIEDIKKIVMDLKLDKKSAYLSIPYSGNYILQHFPEEFYKLYSSKQSIKEVLLKLLKDNSKVVIVDDIIHTGKTLFELLGDSLVGEDYSNIIAIIPYCIVSGDVLYYNIHDKTYTLHPQNNIYKIFLLKERVMMPIEVFILKSFRSVMIEPDILSYGRKYKYYIDGEKEVTYEDMIKIMHTYCERLS